MNIAFITPEFITEIGRDGGLANYIHKISLALQERGHNIYVIVSSDRDEKFIHKGVTVIRVNIQLNGLFSFFKACSFGFYAPFSWGFQSWKLNKVLKKLHHTDNVAIAQYASYTGTAYFRSKNIPCVSRLSSYQPVLDEVNGLSRNLSRKIQHYIEAQALRRSDAIFGPSELIANIVAAKIKKKIEIIESPLSLINESDMQLYNERLKGKKYLLFFGSLGVLKGLKDIAEVLSTLLSKFADLYFVFVGKDFGYQGEPMINYIWKQAGTSKERCLYLGSLEQNFLQPIIENAEAVVLPSRIDNFPNTCIESMAKGKIVIGTRGASFEQIIQDGDNGFLCERGSPASLLGVIEKVLLLDSETKFRVESRAQATTERLNPKIISRNLEIFYEKIIHGNG